MAEDDGSEKTEDPTPKRVDEFRKKGMIPKSAEVNSMAVLFAGFLFAYLTLEMLFDGIMQLMIQVFMTLDKPLNRHGFALAAELGFKSVGFVSLGMLALLTVVGGLVAFLQVGWTPSEEALTLNLERLNPLPGIKRMVSPEALIELAKSSLKLLIVGYIAYQLMDKNLGKILELPRSDLRGGMRLMGELLYTFTLRSLMWLSIMAILDLIWQRYSMHQKMKMSKQEVKDEAKDREGNPQVKSAMRRMARQRLQKTGIENVKKADVVVTNPDHFAIALQYSAGKMRAPMVIARGQDKVAEVIKAEARRYGIPRVENRLLARTLYKISRVGDEIPPEVYAAVAEVLAFVYRIKQQQQAG